MKPYLLLAVIGMVGCAFGQTPLLKPEDTIAVNCFDNRYKPPDCGPKKPTPKKPTGQKPAKKDYLCSGACMTQTDKPEVEIEISPIDVPAIQETRQMRDDPAFTLDCGMAESLGLEGLKAACLLQIPHWTCADKTRILEHDEQDPPKYWCRRVQP